PITESAYTAKIMINKVQSWLGFHGKILDIWYLTFKQAQESLNDVLGNKITPNQLELFKSRLLQMAIVREDMLLSIAIQYMSLSDLLDIGKRMIGTGYIGGKAVGLLLAQAILKKKKSKWIEKLEFQDNYFIGCEVYYTYLVINDFWWKRRKLSNPKTFLQNLEETKKEFLYGNFPRNIVEQFLSMLNYYGQSPIIVRSSSLQEDAYGNSFSGKYESVFLSNQGSIEKRLDNFLTAVRKIYASTISIDALTYRKARNLIEKDEQMALVVQRVSGDMYDHYFLPQVAGTGFSYNPYIWNKKIDPHSGFLRLVLGLGTRAVNRTDSDFTRLVAINQPLLSPLLDPRNKRKYSQQKIDLLDLRDNEFKSIKIDDLIQEIPDFPIEKLAIRDFDMENRMYSYSGKRTTFWIYDFEPLLKNTTFLDDMKEILKELEKVYNNPVDIEYTVNFFNEKDYTINLLQCRPFQVKINASNIDLSEDIPQDSILLETHGPIIGPSLLTNIDRIIYIQPDKYAALSMQDRYTIARLVGKLNNHRSSLNKKILLMGPGRWGTSSPSLGIPVNFAEINHITAMCEMVEMHSGLIPDISLGSHFFNNLVELDILYFGFSPNQEKTFLKREFFINHPNRLSHLIPEDKKWENIIYVIDGPIGSSKTPIRLLMNVVDQQGFCYLKND
ncbi:MAG: PEP/pyruvate-binding domain-containing protein, partial [Promethearchaeota archaeon]